MAKRERWLLLAVAVLTAVVAFTDWPLELTSDFWVDHPMLGAIVSGLVLFAVAAFVVEAWIRAREAAQSRRVSRLGYWGLGQALLVYATGLEELADIGRVEGRAVIVFEGDRARELNEYFETRSEPLPDGIDKRIAVLARDERWLRMANPAIRHLKVGFAESISRWAPVMLTTEQLADMLNRVAAVGDDAGRIHRFVWQAIGDDVETRNEDGWESELGRVWAEAHVRLMSERERLIETGGLAQFPPLSMIPAPR